MDRKRTQQPFGHSPMRTHRATSCKLLLRAGASKRLRPPARETSRRDLYGNTFLWLSADPAQSAERRAHRQSEADSGDHANTRVDWTATWPQYLKKSSDSPQVSIPSEEPLDLWALTGVEYRHHVHPFTKRLRVPRSGDRLVQSPRALVPAFEQSGHQFLSGGFRGGDRPLWSARHFQHRPGGTVHLTGVRECGTQQRHSVQHGRSRAGTRQHLRRTFMEVCEI